MRKVIKNHHNYCVTEWGAVYRILCEGAYISLIPDISTGYPRVELDGKKEYVSRLVLEAFDPTNDETLKAFYFDGNPLNCKLDNLVWLSPSDIQRYSAYSIEYRKAILNRGRS